MDPHLEEDRTHDADQFQEDDRTQQVDPHLEEDRIQDVDQRQEDDRTLDEEFPSRTVPRGPGRGLHLHPDDWPPLPSPGRGRGSQDVLPPPRTRMSCPGRVPPDHEVDHAFPRTSSGPQDEDGMPRTSFPGRRTRCAPAGRGQHLLQDL